MSGNCPVFHFETVGSTQDVAKQYLAEGKPLQFAIRADEQIGGRGRSGNQWVSPKGNLYTTIALGVDGVDLRHAGQYSFLVAVALMSVLEDFGITGAQHKWPNDVLVDHKKIAGILLESDLTADGKLAALMIGMGVNLCHAPEGATSLLMAGIKCLPDEFLDKFLQSLKVNLDQMKMSGFSAIRQRWLSQARGIGTEIKVRLPQESFYGEFLGLDEDGALLVQCKNEAVPRRIYSGEVFFSH